MNVIKLIDSRLSGSYKPTTIYIVGMFDAVLLGTAIYFISKLFS